jgi:WhiB family redox-sensing transcriptional regulator
MSVHTDDDAYDLACLTSDPELWFAQTPTAVEKAKALCHACPVRRACLAGALERHEPWGVWGGQLVERGAVLARKRPMGRPTQAERALRAEEAFAA